MTSLTSVRMPPEEEAMTRQWQLQEAKARLSELVRLAVKDGPQEITLHGKAAVVVLSKTEYDKLGAKKTSFVELIRNSPLVGLDLDIERDRSPMRKVKRGATSWIRTSSRRWPERSQIRQFSTGSTRSRLRLST